MARPGTRHYEAPRKKKGLVDAKGRPIKKRKETPGGQAYKPKEVYEGIEHKIEGRTNLNYKPVTTNLMPVMGAVGQEGTGRYTAEVYDKAGKKAIKANKKTKEEIKGFGLIDEARARIRSIADPADAVVRERKKAARRRMRGRLGTVLTNRETLG